MNRIIKAREYVVAWLLFAGVTIVGSALINALDTKILLYLRECEAGVPMIVPLLIRLVGFILWAVLSFAMFTWVVRMIVRKVETRVKEAFQTGAPLL